MRLVWGENDVQLVVFRHTDVKVNKGVLQGLLVAPVVLELLQELTS